MDTPENDSLRERVDRLEHELAEIKQLLRKIIPESAPLQPAPPPPSATVGAPSLKPIPPAASKGFELPEHMRRSEYWLSRIGIGLLLFGLVFAFKYSIDQGWITPPIRHFFGIGVGILLLVFGWRLYSRRRHFAQLLLGGSIAAFYITDFSAFQLFELIPHPTAFTLMVVITALAFFISLRQDDAIFSLIGAIGGLGTPFMLYTGSGNVPALVVYTCLILAGTAAVYFYKGWRLLLWVSAVGGWIVMLIGVGAAEPLLKGARGPAQTALQVGVIFMWLCFGALPIIRRIVVLRSPARWRAAGLGVGDTALSDSARRTFDNHVHVFTVGSPLIAFQVSMEIWPEIAKHVFGWIAVGGVLIYTIVALFLRRTEPLKSVAYTIAATGAVLLTIGLCLLLHGNTLMLALTAEAVVLHLLGRRLGDAKISFGGHVLSVVIGVWLLVHLLDRRSEVPFLLNRLALTDIIVILAVAAVAHLKKAGRAQVIYGLAAHLALLAWLGRELSGFENGQGYVTIAWGVYGAILLMLGLRLGRARLRQVALGTLILVVAKLFLVDLSELETIWRVLLFMGFGAAFLLLSYYFPKLWKAKSP